MDLMPAHDPLVIEIVWLRSKSEGQGGMHHPYHPSMVGYGKDEEGEKIMKNIMESSVIKNKP